MDIICLEGTFFEGEDDQMLISYNAIIKSHQLI